MPRDNPGGPLGILDFFPGLTEFGLMELARIEDDEPVIDWLLESLPRSFDALRAGYAREFATAALMMFSEVGPALRTMRRIALGRGDRSQAFAIPLIDSLIGLVPERDANKALRGDPDFALRGAMLLDAIEAGIRAIKLVRVASGTWRGSPTST